MLFSGEFDTLATMVFGCFILTDFPKLEEQWMALAENLVEPSSDLEAGIRSLDPSSGSCTSAGGSMLSNARSAWLKLTSCRQ